MKDEEFKRRLVEAVERVAALLEVSPVRGKPKRKLTERELEQRRNATKARLLRDGARTEPVKSASGVQAKVSAQEAGRVATGALIATYCEAFKARYLTNPPVTRKTAGQAAQLLRSLSLERAQELVQAFLQMDGERGWFVTRTHDFGVLVMNLNEVAASLANGTKTAAERGFWTKVFKEGGNDDPRSLQATHRPDAGAVGRPALQRGESLDPLAGLPKRG